MVKKTNTNKIIIGGAVLLGLGAIAYIYKDNIMELLGKKKLVDQGDGDEDPKKPPVILDGVNPDGTPLIYKGNDTPKQPVIDLDTKIIKGQKNDNVKKIQFIIREIQGLLGKKQIKADGDFGKNTDLALKDISNFYKNNLYWTLRKARETWVQYSAFKKLPFPVALFGVSNEADLRKIYSANVTVDNIVKEITD
jgi:hypothetical protein